MLLLFVSYKVVIVVKRNLTVKKKHGKKESFVIKYCCFVFMTEH